MLRHIDTTLDGAPLGSVDRTEVYRRLAFPRGADHPVRRPYTAINMVSTVDGKVVAGGPGTTRLIGSDTDHALMSRIELQADCVLLGAGLIRADDPPYPRLSAERQRQREVMGLRPQPLWAIVSGSGDFPRLPQALSLGGPANTALFTTAAMTSTRREALTAHTRVYVSGTDRVDVPQMAATLRDELGIGSLICLGGPGLNATLIEAGSVDELFVTVAPKLQGGTKVPTLLEGEPYSPQHLPLLELLSLYSEGSELYLRYRVPREAAR